ncbi:MAG: bifunctional phosphopantothenoylcysteine decarboxylase/phosphopantothenate--cysteine ligase CoaBC [Clostridium sp.]|jgi:phosphopantothenoylcysteine decarboxylase/phosphopantothenate--cysteine ligase|nr:bifunctional phosphopantothenoylcysteine decarboxylase/phosphopantothenate--cysteine ligase CoaBC [Clostridium sp.]
MLQGKHVLLGVSGSIAAYKAANLVSMLKKQHAKVTVLMTQNATQFIAPLTFETLTQSKCLVDTFDRSFEYSVEHISLAKSADLFLCAPASANLIAKLAAGIADDMLTTTFLACPCKKLIAPAMNTHMYENPIVQDNMKKLTQFGMEIITPGVGLLACLDVGVGRLPDEEIILEYVLKEIAMPKDLAGKEVLISAGPTQEAIDPVRFITNHSTGKMGYALARAAMLRGADVTLVTGPSTLAPPMFVKVQNVTTAQEMFDAVVGCAKDQDIIIKAAAVADYRPKTVAEQKIKKMTMTTEPSERAVAVTDPSGQTAEVTESIKQMVAATDAYGQVVIPTARNENLAETARVMQSSDIFLPLERTQDILGHLGTIRREGQILCGFSMETENLLENSLAKLKRKNLDLIVANHLRDPGAGFATDTNKITLIGRDKVEELPLLSKLETAHRILDTIALL